MYLEHDELQKIKEILAGSYNFYEKVLFFKSRKAKWIREIGCTYSTTNHPEFCTRVPLYLSDEVGLTRDEILWHSNTILYKKKHMTRNFIWFFSFFIFNFSDWVWNSTQQTTLSLLVNQIPVIPRKPNPIFPLSPSYIEKSSPDFFPLVLTRNKAKAIP